MGLRGDGTKEPRGVVLGDGTRGENNVPRSDTRGEVNPRGDAGRRVGDPGC